MGSQRVTAWDVSAAWWSKQQRLARQIRRTEDALADTEDELWKWGFARKPSEIRRMEEDIERLTAKLGRLRAAWDARNAA